MFSQNGENVSTQVQRENKIVFSFAIKLKSRDRVSGRFRSNTFTCCTLHGKTTIAIATTTTCS